MSKSTEPEVPNTSNSIAELSSNSDEAQQIVQHINILIQSVKKGQAVGAYTLEEAGVILNSISKLKEKFDQK